MASRRIVGMTVASLGRCVVGFPTRATPHRMWIGLGPTACKAAVRNFSSQTNPELTFTASESGTPGTTDYQISFKDVSGKDISPWHDIPLENGNYYNFICEIPRYTTAKMELSPQRMNNPIVQDVKNGKPRFYDGPMFWNYGCLPQTWENPYVISESLKFRGDNDPLDVVEIGSKTLGMGSVSTVKVLGAFAMIDDGELDWKIVAIDVNDRMAIELNDITDVDERIISGIREWFRWYKVPSGKALNTFEFNEVCMCKAVAHEVIRECHDHWLDLVEPEEGKVIATEDRLWLGKGFSR